MIDVNEIPFWAAGAQVVEEDMEQFAEDDVSDVDIYGSNTLDILDEELNHGRAFPTVWLQTLVRSLLPTPARNTKKFSRVNKPEDECGLKVKEVALYELRKKMEMKLTDEAFDVKRACCSAGRRVEYDFSSAGERARALDIYSFILKSP